MKKLESFEKSRSEELPKKFEKIDHIWHWEKFNINERIGKKRNYEKFQKAEN